ncbi:4'-phosphopantetheinyl transferase superfamily protein [Pedobacter nyackensis]|uniref:4'-phosphopantetheinyl transferase family protein n=1 Tax=Pedobacter nyackensis TaxID=475255 RepID=UPI00292CD6AB|nr:4'-phosphopantetheinyl transferase superfamily protein [Pedobacter nyackensis]
MIGNDIVDLNRAAKESNWKRTGYLEKIFTPEEKFLIHTAKDPDILVWLFWSMKEAAYKAATDQTKIRSFAPFLLSCSNLVLHPGTATGNITYDGKLYHSQSIITQTYIHTIAATRTKMLNDIKLKIDDYDAADRSYKESNPTSISHHGSFLALIYL